MTLQKKVIKVFSNIVKQIDDYVLLPVALKKLLEENDETAYSVSLNEDKELYMLNDLSESFREVLFNYIDLSNKPDSLIYKKACIDRRHFSKIRSDKHYHPSYKTVTLLALALELSTAQYESLLHAAAYSLPKNKKEYIVIRYCFDNKIFDLNKVNNYLYMACKKSLNDL